ncbi:MAG: hypothetical protein WB615_15805 [Candidatus Tumulicola sp.]
MRRIHSHTIAAALAGALVLTACAGNANSGALGGGAQQAPVAPFGQAAIINDAGQYSGTTTDTTFGNGSASASLAQAQNVVGGSLTSTFGSLVISNSVAAQTQDGITLAGAEVANVASGACTFSVSATYRKHKHKLDGTYQAVHGCAGESGSFSLTEECSYSRGGLFDAAPAWKRNATEPNTRISPC